MDDDRQTLVFAQRMMRAGVDVALAIVTSADRQSRYLGQMAAFAANGEKVGASFGNAIPATQIDQVLNSGEITEFKSGELTIILMRVG